MPTLKIVDALAVLDIQPDDLQFFTSLDEEFSFIKKKFHAAARTSHPGKKVAPPFHLPIYPSSGPFPEMFLFSTCVWPFVSRCSLLPSSSSSFACCVRVSVWRFVSLFFYFVVLISSPKPLPRPSMFVRQRRNPRGISNRAWGVLLFAGMPHQPDHWFLPHRCCFDGRVRFLWRHAHTVVGILLHCGGRRNTDLSCGIGQIQPICLFGQRQSQTMHGPRSYFLLLLLLLLSLVQGRTGRHEESSDQRTQQCQN